MERDRGDKPDEAGKPRDKDFDTLMAMFGDNIPDELVELIRMMNESGGVGAMDLPTASRLFGGIFESMADKAKSRLLFDFLMQQNLQDRLRPEDLMRRKEKLEYLIGLRRKLLGFVEHLQSDDLRKTVLATHVSLDELRNKDLSRRRMNLMIGQNEFSKLPDALSRMIESDVNLAGTLIEVGERFFKETDKILPLAFEKSDEIKARVLMTEDILLKLEANVISFRDLLRNIMEKIEQWPKHCREIAQVVEHECQEIEDKYGDSDKAGKERPFSALFGRPEQSRDVPFFNNHGFLTAFLDECVDKIPAVDYVEGAEDSDEEDHEEGKQTKYDRRKMSLYAEYLEAHADQQLLRNMSKRLVFVGQGQFLNQIHRIFSSIYWKLKMFVLDDQDEQSPHPSRMHYHDMMQKTLAELSTEEKSERFEDFKIEPILDYLARLDFSKIPSAINQPRLQGVGEESDRRQRLLDLYTSIYHKLVEVAKARAEKAGTDGDQEDSEAEIVRDILRRSIQFEPEEHSEWMDFIEELMKKKAELTKKAEQERKARLRKDKESGNYCYEPQIPGVVGLDFRQVPTEDVTFDHVYGESWKKVIAMVTKMLETEELGYVYSVGAPRGRSRGNILLIGPPGCGKNEFTSAISSDPRVVGVKMTTERIMTPYVGEAEANARRLFEKALEKRQQHGKAAVICWDEIDALFGKSVMDNVGSQVKKSMQKALQSVLSGDKIYDGVYLIGMTNEPDRIPVEVYRRFANVEIIKALSAEERVGLVKHFLGGLPLAEGFEDKIDWANFMKISEHASGDMIGKIVDQVFEIFLGEFRDKHGRCLRTINNELRRMVVSGEKITPEKRAGLYASGTEVRVTPAIFDIAVQQTFSKADIQYAMCFQKEFYENAEAILAEAFKGADVRRAGMNYGDGDGSGGNGKMIFDMGSILSALSGLSGETAERFGEGVREQREKEVVIERVEKKDQS